MVANGPFYHGDLDKDTAAGKMVNPTFTTVVSSRVFTVS